MTRLALGWKSRGLTTPFEVMLATCPSANNRGLISEFNATRPRPAAPRPRNVRRFTCCAKLWFFIKSVPGNNLVQVEHSAGDGGERGNMHGILCMFDRNFASSKELACRFRLGRETLQVSIV